MKDCFSLFSTPNLNIHVELGAIVNLFVLHSLLISCINKLTSTGKNPHLPSAKGNFSAPLIY